MIILERDAVINHRQEEDINTVEGRDPIAGGIEAIKRLNKAGYPVTIASNHSGVARGQYSEDDLTKMHEKMQRLSSVRGAIVDGIFYRPHGPESNSVCGKPKPGLLDQILRKFDINLSETTLVADSISDIGAASIANAKPVLLRTGDAEYTMQHFPQALDVPRYDDRAHFTRDTLSCR